MTLRDAAAESWESLAMLPVPNYPEHEDPNYKQIQARRDAIRAAKDRMDDETAYARVLARRGLPAEAWPEGDPRLDAWRSILWERLPASWVSSDGASSLALSGGYSAAALDSVASRVADASAALSLLMRDAEERKRRHALERDGCTGCRECDPSRFPSVGDDA